MPVLSQQPFGHCPAGQVDRYTLQNDSGHSVRILTYGAVIQSIQVPDRQGQLGEVVIGYDDFTPYLNNPVFFGAIVGRYANRIAGGRFSLDGQDYQLPQNNGPNNLHGGPKGFEKQLWKIEKTFQDDDGAIGLELSHLSPAGYNGFPGQLTVICRYTWTPDSRLIIKYSAQTDAPTVINLTNHSYFNLGGSGSINDHVLAIAADAYTPTDEVQIPTGEIASVAGTPFDFREPQTLGKMIAQTPNGFDHNWVINGQAGTLRQTASLSHPSSGRQLNCLTSQPGVQIFTANFPDGAFTHRGEAPLLKHGAICLETQNFPDAPNKAAFPSAVIRPGVDYKTETEYAFSVEA